jgi:hypothetical protein
MVLLNFEYRRILPYNGRATLGSLHKILVLHIFSIGAVMKTHFLLLASALILSQNAAFAETPATTGLCKDGTPYTGATKKGACKGHKGIKEWYGDSGSAQDATKTEAQTAASAKANETPAEKSVPAGATGLCKDGTAYTGATKKGACKGHKGVKEWYGDSGSAAAAVKTDTQPAAAAKASETPGEKSVPVGATGLCKDGTAYTGATKQGACRGHKGIKEWYGAASAAPAAATSESTATPPSAAAKKESAPAAPTSAKTSPEAPAKAAKPGSASAPGGGAGKVWANDDSKIYHCPDDRFYGKTASGSYMTESEAIAQGYRADHNKPCQ